MNRTPVLTLVASLLVIVATPAQAQFDNVGSIDFPTSATGEAQQHFLRGVATLHSFGWKQAIEQFQAAQKIDPNFAMAYWAESLAYNHPLISQMDATEPARVLQRLAPTRAGRLAKAPTAREKGFIEAVEILWGEGEHVARRVGYMEAMERLYEQYPDDAEVAAFYALSMLSAVAATRDLSQRLNVRAGTITLRLFNENPNHPGAPHYTIHAFDNPLHAPLALQAAYRFSEIAPAVSHARHMPTHIFIQHGMWDRVSGNNESAYQAAHELWRPGDSMGDAIHALDWGQYGDLQRGDYEKARLWIERIETMSGQGGFMEGGARGEAGAARAVNALSLLKSRYIVDTEEWMIQPVTDESSANELLATGLSAARLGGPGGSSRGGGRVEAGGGRRGKRVHRGNVQGGQRPPSRRHGARRGGDRTHGRGRRDSRGDGAAQGVRLADQTGSRAVRGDAAGHGPPRRRDRHVRELARSDAEPPPFAARTGSSQRRDRERRGGRRGLPCAHPGVVGSRVLRRDARSEALPSREHALGLRAALGPLLAPPGPLSDVDSVSSSRAEGRSMTSAPGHKYGDAPRVAMGSIRGTRAGGVGQARGEVVAARQCASRLLTATTSNAGGRDAAPLEPSAMPARGQAPCPPRDDRAQRDQCQRTCVPVH